MILISFKYLSFIRENILLIFNISLPEIPIIFQTIPIGISFYTFQSMSYTIDVYRNQVKPTKNILHFFAYLSMFPQLVAGPIVRAKDLLPQLKKQKINLKYEDIYEAIKSISRGFFKKVFIADNLASFINFNFNSYQDPSSSTWWIVMICFSLQIYCDFSGYSDIAIGLARFMGLRFNKISIILTYLNHSKNFGVDGTYHFQHGSEIIYTYRWEVIKTNIEVISIYGLQ